MNNSKQNDDIKKIQTERIRECMKKYNITGKYMAERLNYTPQHISYVINGKRNLTEDMAINMAYLFSEGAGTEPLFVEYKVDELPPSKRAEYSSKAENEKVVIQYDIPVEINPYYLLGKQDNATLVELIDPPEEKNIDLLFKNGIKAILHFNGYELSIKKCHEINRTPIDDLLSFYIGDEYYKELHNKLTDNTQKSKIVNISTGNTLELLPWETYQLFKDFEKAIVSIIERKYEKARLLDIMNKK